MRESMAQLTPRFSAHRAVREYTEQRYLPAATAYRERSANKGAFGRQLVDWQHSLEQKWDTLRFGEVKLETRDQQHVFEVPVWTDDLDPRAIRVELYADGINGNDPERMEMKCTGTFPDTTGGRVFHATIHAARPASDYTARIIPVHTGAAVPLESARILWQR
jgi:starch phosphorylase